MEDKRTSIQTAVTDIVSGQMTERAACRKYNLNRSHLRVKVRDAQIQNLEAEIEFLRKQKVPEKPEGTLLLYDVHIPHEDEAALEIAIDYAKKNFKIQCVIIGGDFMDCEALSKFDKTKETRRFVDEVYRANCVLREIRATFPDAIIYYVMGNHEERIEHYVRKNVPELADFPQLTLADFLNFEDNEITLVDNRDYLNRTGRVFQWCGWNILHGHELGICPVTDPARRYLERAKADMIVGHIHKVDSRIMNQIDGRMIRCYSVGTLAQMNPRYMPFNSWVQGFAILEHTPGQAIVHNYCIHEGQII